MLEDYWNKTELDSNKVEVKHVTAKLNGLQVTDLGGGVNPLITTPLYILLTLMVLSRCNTIYSWVYLRVYFTEVD